MVKIILCDDDAFTLSMLKEYIYSEGAKLGIDVNIVCCATNSGEVLAFYAANPGEYLFLLDIDLGGAELNGLDLAHLIREKSRDAKIVFVTSHCEKSLAVLKSGVEPFDFIEKQLDRSRMTSELDRCLRRCAELLETETSPLPSISLQVGIDEYVRVPIERISYVETVKNAPHNICYHTSNGSQITLRDSIAHAQNLLGADFVPCHRSILVNKNCVVGLSGSELILADGEHVACAASRRKIFKRKENHSADNF